MVGLIFAFIISGFGIIIVTVVIAIPCYHTAAAQAAANNIPESTFVAHDFFAFFFVQFCDMTCGMRIGLEFSSFIWIFHFENVNSVSCQTDGRTDVHLQVLFCCIGTTQSHD